MSGISLEWSGGWLILEKGWALRLKTSPFNCVRQDFSAQQNTRPARISIRGPRLLRPFFRRLTTRTGGLPRHFTLPFPFLQDRQQVLQIRSRAQ